MVRVHDHLWLATPAGGVRGLPAGVTTLVLVSHVIVAALVILVATMAVTRGHYPWEMRREAVYLAGRCRAEGGDMRDAVIRLHARARPGPRAEQWPWPRNPYSFIKNAQHSFDTRGSVIPVKHGRKSKMPDDVALEIIDLVHAGYDKISIIHGQPILHSVLPIGPPIPVVHAQRTQPTMPCCSIEGDVTLQLCTLLLMIHLLTIKVLPAIHLQAHVLHWEVGIHQAMPQAIAAHSMLNKERLGTLLSEPAHQVCMLLRWHLLPCFM